MALYTFIINLSQFRYAVKIETEEEAQDEKDPAICAIKSE